jgi:hypothetical protein
MIRALTILAILLGLAWNSSTANAVVIYSQNFESGLNANETVVPTSLGFGLTILSPLDNGTRGIGHPNGFDSTPFTLIDVYSLTLDLSNSFGTMLGLDFSVNTSGIHEWGVLAHVGSNWISLIPQSGYIPNDNFDSISPFPVNAADRRAFSGTGSGRAIYDLGAFDGQANFKLSIGLGVQNHPLGSAGERGYFIDNILVEAVPEPAGISLLACALGILVLRGFKAGRAHP